MPPHERAAHTPPVTTNVYASKNSMDTAVNKAFYADSVMKNEWIRRDSSEIDEPRLPHVRTLRCDCRGGISESSYNQGMY